MFCGFSGDTSCDSFSFTYRPIDCSFDGCLFSQATLHWHYLHHHRLCGHRHNHHHHQILSSSSSSPSSPSSSSSSLSSSSPPPPSSSSSSSSVSSSSYSSSSFSSSSSSSSSYSSYSSSSFSSFSSSSSSSSSGLFLHPPTSAHVPLLFRSSDAFPGFLHVLWTVLAPGMRHFHVSSMVSCPFEAEVRSNLPLLRPTLSISTCPLHSRPSPHALSQPCRLHLPTSLLSVQSPRSDTHASFYTNQLLHQPTFTQTRFYPKHFSQKTTFTPTSFYTNPLLHKLAFPETTFYTNQLLQKRAFTHTHSLASTQTNFLTNQLLQKPRFAPTDFYEPALTQIRFDTNRLSNKPTFRATTFYANHLLHQPALHNPCFGPVSQRPEGRRTAEGC